VQFRTRKEQTMKKSFFAVLAAVGLTAGNLSAQFVFDFGTLPSYGSGANVSAFVVDWNNGSPSEVIGWAYRWDTAPTMETMMADIAAAGGSKLFMRWDSDAGFGAFLFGLGYQNGVTPFGVINAVDGEGDPAVADFVAGVWNINTGPGFDAPAAFTGVAANAGDFYAEGYSWSSYVAGSAPDFTTSVSQSSFFAPSNWTATSLGISSVTLVNEGWYGFGNGRVPLTIPEPSSLLLLAMGGVFFLHRRSGRWSRAQSN
jgi:hypothetical protein